LSEGCEDLGALVQAGFRQAFFDQGYTFPGSGFFSVKTLKFIGAG
jgi:hypothetical protein